MILGLCGEKQAGKDTIAAYLVKRHQFERKAFADPLKRSVAALFDIPFHEVDKLKLDPYAHVVIEDVRHPARHLTDMSFRQMLQRYGTESHRNVFSEDFWLNLTLPVGGFYPGRNLVITDLRFDNEAERVKYLGGSVVRIYRSQALTGDSHPSENYKFDADYIIYNNGTLDELWESVESMLVTVADHDYA